MLTLGKRNLEEIVTLFLPVVTPIFDIPQTSDLRLLLRPMDVRFQAPYNEKNQPLGESKRVPLDLKSTINLPRTDFPMKANLPKNEPKILTRWEQMKIYERVREVRKSARVYVLHDGPPYANGPVH